MKKKLTFLADLAVLVLCVCAIAIGVYSAKNANLNVGGTVGFNAHDCDVDIDAILYGDSVNANQSNAQETDFGVVRSKEFAKTFSQIKIRKNESGASTGALNLEKFYFCDMTNDDSINPIAIEITFTNRSKFNIRAKLAENVATGNENIVATPNVGDSGSAVILEPEAKGVITITLTMSNAVNVSAVNLQAKFSIFKDEDTIASLEEYEIKDSNGVLITQEGANVATDGSLVANETYSISKIGETDGYKFTITPKTNMTTSAYFDISNRDKLTATTQASIIKDGVEYEIAGEATATTILGTPSTLEIPDFIKANNKYYPITSIGSEFAGGSQTKSNETLTEIVIGDNVTSIGDCAFQFCTNLITINIPYGVTLIDVNTFWGCYSLTSITIPESVTSIYMFAFANCKSLRTVIIPDGVTSIGMSAFADCESLNTVTIPNSVTSIEPAAFIYCTNLISVNIPNGLTSISEQAFYCCSKLTSIIIPESVTSIDNEAFGDCYSLVEVYLLSDSEFYPESGLLSHARVVHRDIETPTRILKDEINKVYYYVDNTEKVFLYSYDKTVTSINIDTDTTSINQFAFSFMGTSSLTSITIPDSVTNIGYSAFYGCTLTFVNVSGMEKWCNIEFENEYSNPLCNNNTKLYFDGNEVKITELVIPAGVKEIKQYTFYNWVDLTSVTIPDGVTSIGNYAFASCIGLTTINIPNSVAGIGEYAFKGCKGLTAINIPNSETWISFGVFLGCAGLTSITIPNSVTQIEAWAFKDCTSLTSIIIPNSVTRIGSSAFSGCTGLTSIIIPNSVTQINDGVFSGCTGLTSITIPNSVTYIGYAAFKYCEKLTTITIPSSVTYIGRHAFNGCTSLTTITIPDSVTYIGYNSFGFCENLTTTIGEGWVKESSGDEVPSGTLLKDIDYNIKRA